MATLNNVQTVPIRHPVKDNLVKSFRKVKILKWDLPKMYLRKWHLRKIAVTYKNNHRPTLEIKLVNQVTVHSVRIEILLRKHLMLNQVEDQLDHQSSLILAPHLPDLIGVIDLKILENKRFKKKISCLFSSNQLSTLSWVPLTTAIVTNLRLPLR